MTQEAGNHMAPRHGASLSEHQAPGGGTRRATRRFTGLRVRAAAGLLSVLALAACELALAPEPSAVLDDALPESTAIPAAWSSKGAASSAVGDNWVASFRDSRMTSLVNEALTNNRDLTAAAARVQAALQTAQIAGAPIMPWVGASAGSHQIRNLDADRTHQHSGGGIAVSWEVDLWGKLRSNQAAAVAGAGAVANEAVWASQSIAATVGRSWIAYIEIGQLLAAADDVVDQYAQLVSLAQKREAAGVVSDFDVVQAQGRLNAAKAARVELRAQSNEAAAALEVLLGRYPSLKLKPASSYPRMPGTLSAGLPLSLLDRRPDVVAAREQVIAAFYNVEVAKLTRLPGISLTAAGGKLVDPSLALLGAGNPGFLQIGVGLLQPIFMGGALQADVVRMTARQAEATANYGQTVLEAFGEVEARMANEQLLRQALGSWRASYDDAKDAVQLGEKDYDAGTIDMVALLYLTEFAIGRRINVIQSQSALLTNRVNLYLALGESY
ncbi:efflux transporter outer membrane subunit [Meridianimarinicoccus sp. MJW13]|uniref:efflux transporter outer membrane subunit n=1 Tax=Meridianimarinicoccus sp. MJW13 TaxID=2720031 RepID=UPI0018689C4E|nr:efflux transporter outer membrane subunit [Fluviibacterium sp. MJW13]